LYKHKLDVLEGHCKAVGRDFREIEKSCWLGGQIFIVSNRKELDEKILQLKPKNVSLEEFNKLNFVATPDDCVREIRRYVRLGVTYFMLFFGDSPDLSGVRLFSETVIKTLTQ
jgi:alkanesulfonate monooxygenase SsuD/methylene tetrahydromethanopterin reductase-like flavin-dependent oxidoreductase (luciferase family)